ncbi:hypothetical protein BN2497_7631 [Janthinobacterium sp. CG23_2]|nr:hypothetical protein BN2497_7631 [Janthinobacterium sp. CG23_2]CUU30213.1 hypothetical protein BN3177_7631 [Janthinobacterium sp. CG23_2]
MVDWCPFYDPLQSDLRRSIGKTVSQSEPRRIGSQVVLIG